MNIKYAEELVRCELIKKKFDDYAVMLEVTEESENCFAVYYQTKKYIKTNNTDFMSIGNGPVIVNKSNGELYFTGSGRPTEHLIESFEKYGHPEIVENQNELQISYDNSKEVSYNNQLKVLKKLTGKGFLEVKSIYEYLKNGNNVIVKNDLPDELKESLISNGFIVSYPLVEY
ncbi:hypothetical protein [Aureibacter tunicatorum]|uniref:Immunity protein 35 domain-containing protein n=1 Tax=Aureibacter tunicatorum TaxID=866807 RepID=A0AAE3XTC8_9BACT|nr:hypothetical protein [Aureibacter tunicatorum]MDR6241501.1 hypothetical protein [Aureibacter tunicatorum]BDD07041.1 hypothetical protein AUTU_45240 [Aureibacter tunicatorum]